MAAGEFSYADAPQEGDPDFGIMVQPNSPYFQDMFPLLRRFQLDRHLMPLVWKLAKYGKVERADVLYVERMPLISFKKPEKDWDTLPKIVIELRTHSTLQDVKKVWRTVEQYRKMFKLKVPKFKLWKNFERDSRVYELYSQGKTLGEIDKAINAEYKDDLDYGNIKKIVSTYRKKMGLPKGGKLITSPIKRKRELR